MNIPDLSANIARRIPEMSRDCATNNAELIQRMICDELAGELAREKCTKCGREWNPALIESGECVFCTMKELRAKLTAAEAACGEMRGLLERYGAMGPTQTEIMHALSTSCGKDFIPRDEVKPLVEFV